MRKFLLNTVLFLSIFLVCNTVVYFFAQDFYHEEYNKVPEKRFSTFIFADSYGLPLSEYSEDYDVYNFAAASDSYFDIKRKLTYLIRNNYKIDKVYIGVDSHSLSPNREQMNNLDRSVCYATKEDFDNSFDYFKDRYVRYYGAIFRPSVRTILRSYLFQNIPTILNNNQSNEAEKKNWSQLSNKEKNAQAEDLVEIQFPSDTKSETLEQTLKEIIALSKAYDFELVGVKFPLTESYTEAVDNASFGANRVFADYGLQVLDYRRMYLGKNEYFADPNHLNDTGGEIFTEILLSK